MAYAIPSSSLSITAATSAPWLTEHPKSNLTNISFATTPSMSTSSSISTYATQPPSPSTPTTPTTTPLLPSPLPTQPTTLNLTCSPQPPSYGPLPPVENTPYSFSIWPQIRQPALSALTPLRYTLSFRDANASYVGSGYLGHYELRSYDARECARKCDGWGDGGDGGARQEGFTGSFTSIPSDQTPPSDLPTPSPQPSPHPQICNGFNLYFERSPSIHLGPNCRDAASRTIIKCALWGEGVEEEGATNTGYTEWDFNVVIAGSNGYRLGGEEKTSEGVKSVGRNVGWSGGLMAISVAVVLGWLVVGF